MIKFNKILITVWICLGSMTLVAGDDPCTAINLSSSNLDFLTFDNSGNSDSGVEAPPLGGYSGADIWFEFIMPFGEVSLLLQQAGMIDPAVAIYTGNCDDPQLIYNVPDNNCEPSVNPEFIISDLEPGETYLIRVWAQNGSSDGTFGLFLGTNIPTLLGFEVYDDASIQGDCIELTPEIDTQHGCAWYQLEIDFTQPFTHDMIANFGDNFFNGADGICLVYQTNGPNFCGSTGSGIGAEGMPNSAIFEFDTYQNDNPYFDPFIDHASFNVNGDMTHPASINGPVTLGNIEDGNDHTISFSWNPIGNLYQLYFDGDLILSGSYDIINNCFGGSTLAYWGYTASTGGSNNNHIICPLNVEYTPSTVSYVEINLCAGESYNGWTESGFYISDGAGANGCIHQTHTLLTILEESDSLFLERYICKNDTFEIENQIFSDEGVYTIKTETNLGCDSTIILDLKVISATFDSIEANDITCLQDSISLPASLQINYLTDSINYIWNTPIGMFQTDTMIATSPGLYEVTASINYEEAICIVHQELQINIDTIRPILNDIPDLTIFCTTSVDESILVISEVQDSVDYNWIFDDNIVGINDTLPVSLSGIYTLSAQNIYNGCKSTTEAEVVIDSNIPIIEMDSDTLMLNCQTTEHIITPTISYQAPGILVWSNSLGEISNDTSIIIDKVGTYTMMITDVNGCFIRDSIVITQDTISPNLFLEDIIIPCDQTDTLINSITNSDHVKVSWNGPQVFLNNITPVISTEGFYSVTLTDTTNFCTVTSGFSVNLLGPTPQIDLVGEDTLNCNLTEIELAVASINEPSINWYDSNFALLSEGPLLKVTMAGTYLTQVISSTGCTATDSIKIYENFIYPNINLEADTIDCDNEEITIMALIENGTIDNWNTPANDSINSSIINTNIAGQYTVTATNKESGCSTSASIEVIDLSNPPIYTYSDNTITCIETTSTLDLDISSEFENVTWTFPNGIISNEISPETSIDGTYILHIEVEGSCDLDTIIEIAIDTISPHFNLDYGTLNCSSNSTYLNLTEATNLQSVTIISPSNILYNELENTVSEEGLYDIITIGNNGCSTTRSIEIVSLISLPEVTIENDELISCNQPSAMITAISDNPNLTYSWSDIQNNELDNGTTLIVEVGGTYILTVVDENDCENTYTLDIEEQLNSPNITLGANPISCNQTTSTLLVESDESLNQILLYNVDNDLLATDSPLEIINPGWYYAQVSNIWGCETLDSIFISANIEAPMIELISEDTILLLPNSSSLISIQEISNDNNEYHWFPEEGLSCIDCLEPTITEYVHDSYQLTVINENGCSTTLTVYVGQKKLTEVIIPNIFSPSIIDGNNDYFTLYANENIRIINEMLVYDRWGNLLYIQNNFLPNEPTNGWDGTFKGEAVTNGVYIYLFKVTTTEGEILTFTGDVTRI